MSLVASRAVLPAVPSSVETLWYQPMTWVYAGGHSTADAEMYSREGWLNVTDASVTRIPDSYAVPDDDRRLPPRPWWWSQPAPVDRAVRAPVERAVRAPVERAVRAPVERTAATRSANTTGLPNPSFPPPSPVFALVPSMPQASMLPVPSDTFGRPVAEVTRTIAATTDSLRDRWNGLTDETKIVVIIGVIGVTIAALGLFKGK